MPCLIANSVNETYDLNRRLTSVGPHHANHIVVHGTLDADTYAHVLLEKGRYVITTLDRKVNLMINGKRTRKHVLEHSDQLELQGLKLEFNLWKSAGQSAPAVPVDSEILGAYQKLASFSVRLAQEVELDGLFDVLMDQVIELSGADKGFLLFKEVDELRIQSARNVNRETLDATMAELSDSIISNVLKTKAPLIVSDALTDTVFKSSASVMNLKLCSVICAPLVIRGEIFGIIYLGNDNIVNLFTKQSLDILSIFASQAALLLNYLMVQTDLVLDNANLRAQMDQAKYGNLIGSSAAMAQVFSRIERIAPTNVNVLVLGETGTGKELVAREIHKRSERAGGPFIAINCGALPENLMESEIFGHSKGAFTGAIADKKGCFEVAQGGTLFLDEIGDMSPKLQVKLLRAIQERQITRVGDTSPRSVDIRLLTATHVDLEDAIVRGKFREDLYYRINVVGLRLPPLSERDDDVVQIANYLLNKFAMEFQRKNVTLSEESIRALLKHSWPGNIRELENRLRKGVLLSDNRRLTPDDLELNPELQSQSIRPLSIAKEEFQSTYIDEILALNNFNRTKTAKDLEVDPRTIFRHLEKKREQTE
jgi:transcriptional regulator with GAF, ATPase, and Fis domain